MSNIPQEILDMFLKAYEEDVLPSFEVVLYNMWKKLKDGGNETDVHENQYTSSKVILNEESTNNQLDLRVIIDPANNEYFMEKEILDWFLFAY